MVGSPLSKSTSINYINWNGDSSSVPFRSTYLLTQSPNPQQMRPLRQETSRRHFVNVEALHGKLAELPRHWLMIRFLLRASPCAFGMLSVVGLFAGFVYYKTFVKVWFDGHKDSGEYENCQTVMTFSMPMYQALPAAIILSLPGSGLRVFDPFKRAEANAVNKTNKDQEDPSYENSKDGASTMVLVRRCFIFQVCEGLAVVLMLFVIRFVIAFPVIVLSGITNSCGSIATQLFLLGAAVCCVGLFTVLYYFTRYREHIKMQLCAFPENAQTGELRNNVDLRADKRLEVTKKITPVVKTRLYYATRRGDLDEMRDILNYAKSKGLMSDEIGFPRKVYAAPTIRWKFFARSRENPVHIAAGLGNIRALELLREYDFDLAVLDKVHRVMISTGGLFLYFIQLFVNRPKGSDEDSASSIFYTTLLTPLHCAVATGQLDTVRWLLERGAPPGTLAEASFRSNRIPPLFLAEHAEIARELLVHGADSLVIPDPGCMTTMTPLQLAYIRGNFAVVLELEEWGSDVALTPYHLAAAQNNVKGVRKFLARKTDVDCLGEMGYVGINRRTPLHWADISGVSCRNTPDFASAGTPTHNVHLVREDGVKNGRGLNPKALTLPLHRVGLDPVRR